MAAKRFAVLLLFVTACCASVIRHDRPTHFSCGGLCLDNSEDGYSFPPGHTYVYELDSKTSVDVAGSENSESWVRITGRVEIQALTRCELVLRLSQISLRDSEPNQDRPALNTEEFREALQRKPVSFSLTNGRITGFCPSQNEPTWVLNIKRGIVSAFQNSMDSMKSAKVDDHTEIYEDDVVGKCLTQYTVKEATRNEEIKIQKSKELSSCTDRASHYGSIQSVPYTNAEEAQSLPLLSSSHNCDQIFNARGHLISVFCLEVHRFKPFSQGGNGAASSSSLRLTFVQQVPSSRGNARNEFQRSPITFQAPEDALLSEHEAELIARNAVLAICAVPSIRKNTPEIFSHLVKTLKDVRNIERLRQRVLEHCTAANSILGDALPLVQTGEAYSAMKRFIREGHVSPVRAKLWYSEIAFAQKPDRIMISELHDLIGTHDKAQVLGASAVINRYCMQNPECYKNREIRVAVDKITGNGLNQHCRIASEHEDNAILSLKALGNIGQFDHSHIYKCIEHGNNPLNVRLAAIEAFRRVPCSVERKPFMVHLKNNAEALEIRAAAYLESVRCPSRDLVLQLTSFLRDQDKNSHIGAFIYWHLKNINPESKLGQLITNEVLPHHFLSANVPNLSKYGEFEKKFPGLHSTVKGQGYTLFDQGYVPNKAMLNVTVDMFGNSVNLFEVGGHARGIDKILEKYMSADMFNMIKGPGRQKRSITTDSVNGIAYIKLFGNEMGYTKLDDLSKAIDTGLLISNQKSQSILDYLARDKEMDWNKNVVFLDSSITVPTVSGLPLKLSVNGSASLMLKMKGKADMRQLMHRRGELDINGYIRPSTSVLIQGSMTIDAFHSISGLKFSTSMHQSTNLDGKIEMREGKDLKIRWNVPEHRMDFIDMETKLVTMHRHSTVDVNGQSLARVEKSYCSGEKMSNIFGFKLCGEVSYPEFDCTIDTSHFPLSGPVTARFYWQKTDLQLTHYVAEAGYENSEDRKSVKILFDTPGSLINRRINTELSLNIGAKEALIDIKTPSKKLSVTGKYEWNLKRRMALIEFISDNSQYDVLAKLDYDGESKYTPVLRMSSSSSRDRIFDLNGNVLIDEDAWSGDMALSGITQTPMLFKGSLMKDRTATGMTYTLDLSHENSRFRATSRGQLQSHFSMHEASVEVNFIPVHGTHETIILNAKIGKDSEQGSIATVSWTNTMARIFKNGFAEGKHFSGCRNERSKTDRNCEVTSSLVIGQDRENIKFDSLIYYKPQSDSLKTQWELGGELKSAPRSHQYGFKITHLFVPEQKLHCTMQFNKNSESVISSWLKLTQEPGSLVKVTGDLGFTINEMHQHLKASLQEQTKKHFSFVLTHNHTNHSDRDDFELKALYRDHSDAENEKIKYAFDTDIWVRSDTIQPIKLKGQLEKRAQYLDVAVKGQYGEEKLTAEVHHSIANEQNKFNAEMNGYGNSAKLYGHWKSTVGVTEFLMNSDVNSVFKTFTHGKLEQHGDTEKAAKLALGFDYNQKYYGAHVEAAKAIKKDLATHVVMGKIRYPGQIITLSTNTSKSGPKMGGSYQTDILAEWDNGKSVSMRVSHDYKPQFKSHFKLTSPWLNNMEANILHKQASLQGDVALHSDLLEIDYQTKVSAKHFRKAERDHVEAKISGRSGTNQDESDLVITFQASKSDREMKSEMRLKHLDKEFKLIATAEKARTNPATILNGGLTLHTPYQEYKEIGILVSHRYSSQGINSDLGFKINENNVNVHIGGRHLLNSEERIMEGTFKIDCPYSANTWEMKLRHKNTDSHWRCALKVQRGTHFIDLLTTGNILEENGQIDLEGEMKLKSSASEISGIRMHGHHRHVPHTYTSLFVIEKDGFSMVKMKSNGKMTHHHERPAAIGSLELELPGDRKATLSLDSYVNISTPQNKGVKFEVMSSYFDGLTDHKAAVLIHGLYSGNENSITMQLVTPMESAFKDVEWKLFWKPVQFMGLPMIPNEFHGSLKWHPAKQLWFNSNLQGHSLDKISYTFDAGTEKLNDNKNHRIHFKFNHTGSSSNGLQLACTSKFEKYQTTGNFNGKHNHFGYLAVYGLTHMVSETDAAETLTAEIGINGIGDALLKSAGIILTFNKDETYDATLETYFNSRQAKLEMSLNHLGERFVELSVSGTTPFDGFEKLAGTSRINLADFWKSNIENEISVGRHQAKSVIQWSFAEQKWSTLNRIDISDAGSSWLNILVKSSGMITEEKANGQFVAQWTNNPDENQLKITFGGHAQQIPSNMEMKISIITPFNGLQNIECSAALKPTEAGHTARFELTRNSQKLSLSLEIATAGRTSVFATLETPFSNFESASLTCAYDSQQTRRHTVLCSYTGPDNNEIKATVEGGYDDQMIDGFMELETPYSGWEDISVQVIAKYPSSGEFRVDLEYGWGVDQDSQQTMILTTIFKAPDSNLAEFSVTLRTPFEPVRDWNLHGKGFIGFDKAEVDLGLQFEPKKKIRMILHFENGETIQGRLHLTTPFESARDQEVNIILRQNGEGRQIGTKGLDLTDLRQGKVLSVEVKWDTRAQVITSLTYTWYNPTHVELKMNFQTPVYGFENREADMKVKLNKEEDIFEARLECRDSGLKTFAFEVNHKMTYYDRMFSGHFKLYYPIGLHSTSLIKYEATYPASSLSTKIQWMANNRLVGDLHLNFGSRGKLFDLFFDNMWYPFEAKYLVSSTQDAGYNFESTVCWNLREYQTSLLHLKFSKTDMSQENARRTGFGITLAIPSRTVAVSTSVHKAADRLHKTAEVTWDLINQQKAGYEVTWSKNGAKKDFRANIWSPIRSMELSGNHEDTGRKCETEITVKYDLSRSGAVVTLKNELHKHHRSHKMKTTFQHPLLPHEISSTIETMLISEPRSATIKHDLVYSADASKKLSLSVTLRCTTEGNTTAILHLTHVATDINFQATVSIYRPLMVEDRAASFLLKSSGIHVWLAASHTSEIPFKIEALNNGQAIAMQLKCRLHHCEFGLKKDSDYTLLAMVKENEHGFYDAKFNTKPFHLGGKRANNFYKLRGKWTKRVIGIECDNKIHGKTHEDFLGKATLDGSHKLMLNFLVRPGMHEDLQQIAEDTAGDAIKVIRQSLKHIVDGVKTLNFMFVDVFNSISIEMRPLGSVISVEKHQLSLDISKGKTKLVEAYEMDAMYLKTMGMKVAPGVNKAAQMTNYIYSKVQPMYYQMAQSTFASSNNLLTKVRASAVSAANAFSEKVASFSDKSYVTVFNWVKEGGRGLEIATTRLVTMWEGLRQRFGDNVEEIWDGIADYLLFNFEQYMEHPYIREAVSYLRNLENQTELTARMIDQVLSTMDGYILQHVPWVKDNVVLCTMEAYWTGAKQQAIALWNYWGVKYQMKEALWGQYRNFRAKAVDKLESLLKKYTGFRETKITYYNPRDGKIEVQIWIPVPIYSVNQVPDYKTWEEYHQANRVYHKAKRYYNRYHSAFSDQLSNQSKRLETNRIEKLKKPVLEDI